MVAPARADVIPRVRSPESHERVQIDDAVRALLAGRSHGAVEIVGGRGSGKTTAICHLAARFGDDPRIAFCDDGDGDLEGIARLARDHVVLFTSATAHPERGATPLPLCEWTEDDVIEHLLATAPGRCASVVQRLRSAGDLDVAGGSPEILRVVVDRMAADDDLPGVRATLHRLLDEGGAATGRLLDRHRAVKVVARAREILLGLESGRIEDPDVAIGADLVPELATLVRTSAAARAALERAIDRAPSAPHAVATSILVASDHAWCRRDWPGAVLPSADLSGARWPEARMAKAKLPRADLSGADLADAVLDEADLSAARLDEAVLRGAKLFAVTAESSSWVRADVRDADLADASLVDARLTNARFDRSCLSRADLRGADLVGARFAAADLSGARLVATVLAGADLSDATLDGASMNALDLRTTRLDRASLAGAYLRSANLAGARIDAVTLVRADLTGADLSGTRLARGRLAHAILRECGLADVDWEHADLRGADLQKSTFHFGSTRSGLCSSPIVSEGSRTGFYTNELDEQHFKAPEEIRKANLRFADLRGARLAGVDLYLVDLRGALLDAAVRKIAVQTGAILDRP